MSRRRALPNALGRLARNRPMLVAVVVLLGLGVSATGMSQLTELRLTQAVNRNWRGAYDILVTPRMSGATAGAARTSGLIEPDFLTYGGHGGISFAQLDEIRRISGVAVAAPVSTVGYVTAGEQNPTVNVPLSSLPRKPTLYRVSLLLTTSDGVHRFAIARQTIQVALGRGRNGSASVLSSAAGWDGGADGYGVDLEMLDLVPQVTAVVAVDPRAERQLFGRSFGFLKALAIKPSNLRVARFPTSLIPHQFWAAQSDLGALQDDVKQGGDIANAAGAYPAEPVVPIVVSKHLAYPVRLTLTVDRIGRPLPSVPQSHTQPVYKLLAIAAQEAGPGLTLVGSSSVNVSGKRAFEPTPLEVPWPGSRAHFGGEYATTQPTTFATQLARRGSYRRARALRRGMPAFRIRPLGLVGWDGQAAAGVQEGPVIGGSNATAATQSYRSFTSVPFVIKPHYHPVPGVYSLPQEPFFLAPVGSFDFAKLRLPSNPLNHVPLGAWEPAHARMLGKDGRPGAVLGPTQNPLGFLTSPPEVIANIDQASLLRGPDPIDAIRVRVAGLSGFDAASRAKVERVATRIAALGLDARIVAGSSPRTVDVYVPKYLAGGRDLGWVQEDWTSLGAAQAASSALSGAEKALLFLGLALALLLAVTVSSVGLEGGARDVQVWRSLGWSRRRVLWWLVSDATLGGLLVAVAAVVATLAGGRLGLLAFGLALGGSLLGIQLVFALLLLRRELSEHGRTGARRRLFHRAGSIRTSAVVIAFRSVLRQARISVLIAVGVTLSSIVVLLALASLRSASRSAQNSLLGAYLDTTLLAFHAVSLALLVVGGLAATAIATRAWQRRRTGEISAFAALGWRRRRVLNELRLERLLLALFAALLALAVAAALHGFGVAVGGSLAVVIVVVLCSGYVLAGELPARRLVQSRWPT